MAYSSNFLDSNVDPYSRYVTKDFIIDNYDNFDLSGDQLIAVKSPGLYAWGNNSQGTVGDSTVVNKSSPTAVSSKRDWKQVVGSVGVKTNGSLWTWGNNISFALGNVATAATFRSSPVQVSTSLSFSFVASSYDTRLALTANSGAAFSGMLVGFGNNITYQTGTGANTLVSPILFVGGWANSFMHIGRWKQSQAGWYAGTTYDVALIARKVDGTLWGWGATVYGDAALRQYSDAWSLPELINQPSSIPPVPILTHITSGRLSWKQIAGAQDGYNYIGLRSDGVLYTWGDNTNGLLARAIPPSSAQDYYSPLIVDLTGSYTMVAAGLDAFYAIKTDGTLWAWGYNDKGQLGLNDTVSRSSPVLVSAGSFSYNFVAAGLKNAYALRSTGAPGKMYAWGLNDFGQLGSSSIVTRSSPVAVSTTASFTMVSAADKTAVGLSTTGALWLWGDNDVGQLGNSFNNIRSSPVQLGSISWSMVSAGASHIMAIKVADGTLWGWGSNYNGQLGNPDYPDGASSPVLVTIPGVTSVSNVVAGGYTTMAVASDNSLWAWGFGGSDLYTANTTFEFDVSLPSMVSGQKTRYKKVVVGNKNAAGIGEDGMLYTWGDNLNGSAGHASSFRFKKVAHGRDFCIAIDNNGRMWGWGNNAANQLGLGPGAATSYQTPQLISTTNQYSYYYAKAGGLNAIPGYVDTMSSASYDVIDKPEINDFSGNWHTVACGDAHCIAVDSNGGIFTWGNNTFGQLGTNDTQNKNVPTKIGYYRDGGLFGDSFVALPEFACGSTFTVYCSNPYYLSFGENTDGQLGTNDKIHRSSPVTVTGYPGSGIGNVRAGDRFVYVSDNYQQPYMWGNNAFGQLGDNTVVSRSSPVTLVGLGQYSVTLASLGKGHTIIAGYPDIYYGDKPVYGHGLNTSGQLGLGVVSNRSAPTHISSSGRQVGAGAFHSHYISQYTGGAYGIYCFGLNTSGQLGDNTIVSKSLPVQISTFTHNGDIHGYGIQDFGSSKSNTTIFLYPSDIEANTYVPYAVGAGGATSVVVNNLGVPVIENKSTPVQITAYKQQTTPKALIFYDNLYGTYSLPNNVVDVTLGEAGGHALLSDGSLYNWGYSYNQTNGRYLNKPNTEDRRWIRISTGHDHVLAMDSKFVLWGWGANDWYQLGANAAQAAYVSSPVVVSGSTSNVYPFFAAGNGFSLFCRTDGLSGLGRNDRHQLGLGSNTTIRHENEQNIITFSDANGLAALRDPANTDFSMSPILAGNNHSGMVYYNSNIGWYGLYMWGSNQNNKISNAATSFYTKPTNIFTLNAYNQTGFANSGMFLQLTSGSTARVNVATDFIRATATSHGLVNNDIVIYDLVRNPTTNAYNGTVIGGLTQNTSYYVVQANTTWFKLSTSLGGAAINITSTGTGTSAHYFMKYIANTTQVKMAALGLNHTAYVERDSGRLIQMGSDGNGSFYSTPTIIGSNTLWTKLKSHPSADFTVGVISNTNYQYIYTWGSNDSGQLGNGTTINNTSPGLILTSFGDYGGSNTVNSSIQISVGPKNVLVYDVANTSLYAWGNKSDVTTGQSLSAPTAVTSFGILPKKSYYSYSNSAHYAIAVGGSSANGPNYYFGVYNGVYMTGLENSKGQLNGSNVSATYTSPSLVNIDDVFATSNTTYMFSPAPVITTNNIVSVVSGYYHTLALDSGGTVLSWGDNLYGQLGKSSNAVSSNITRLSNVYSFPLNRKIAAGPYQSAIIRSDGSLWMWGNNSFGQLGDSSVAMRSAPTIVSSNAYAWKSVSITPGDVTYAIRDDLGDF